MCRFQKTFIVGAWAILVLALFCSGFVPSPHQTRQTRTMIKSISSLRMSTMDNSKEVTSEMDDVLSSQRTSNMPDGLSAKHLDIYDTTLRDGTQGESVSVTVDGKLAIAKRLGEFGMAYIEGGWPGSNPKDAEFFARARAELPLSTWRRVVAFGSTRRKFLPVEQDKQIAMLLESEAGCVCIVGKSWDLHIDEILEVPREENLAMVADSVAHLKAAGREVMLDLEHFFDGMASDPACTLDVCRAAVDAGVDVLVLCDTNGGRLPWEIEAGVRRVAAEFPGVRLGIHCHNDQELAVANSLAALRAGCSLVQGTVNGVGERTGNANLASLVPTLQLKMGYAGVGRAKLRELTGLSRFVDEMMNRVPAASQPWVGASAFAHKGGIHVSAMAKNPASYQHVDPAVVGNTRRVLVSDLAGRSNIIAKVKEFGLCLTDEECAAWADSSLQILNDIKVLEKMGYSFEGAEASVELMLRRMVENYAPPFNIVDYSCQIMDQVATSHTVTQRGAAAAAAAGLLASGQARATVKMEVSDGAQGEGRRTLLEVAEGNGPVDALGQALRRGLEPAFPLLREVRLSDYKVRILDHQGAKATASTTRVMIEFKRHNEFTGLTESWTTVGVDSNIISASFNALSDGFEYFLALKCDAQSLECRLD
mmetsp:Transcript_29949/g.48711  ORF Transcript_29949/g.48711 Transcript_29949/m.48711 type:complete len:650 (-) Transcript_29949:48-1997(-)